MNWPSVVGTLAATLVGALAAFSGVVYQQRRTDRREANAAKGRASSDLLTHSMMFAQRAQALQLTAQVRSGLHEGLDRFLHGRSPIDPMELHDWLAKDLHPLYDAWSATWLASSPAMVTRGNAVLDACTDVVDALGEQTPLRGPARLRQAVQPRRLDKDQATRLHTAVRTLAVTRRDYADLVRKETRQEPAELFFKPPP